MRSFVQRRRNGRRSSPHVFEADKVNDPLAASECANGWMRLSQLAPASSCSAVTRARVRVIPSARRQVGLTDNEPSQKSLAACRP